MRNPVVTVDSTSGEILSVESDVEGVDRCAGVEFYSGIITAGFINMHSHLELSYLKGAIEEGCGFAAFAAKIGSIRSDEKYTSEVRNNAAANAIMELAREGVKAVADIVNGSTTFELKSEQNRGSKSQKNGTIEYQNFAEIFGLKTNNLEQSKELIDGCNNNLKISLTQHSTYSLNDKIFKEIAKQDPTQPLSIHFLESKAEIELFEGHGSLHEWYAKMGFNSDFLEYGSPAKRIIASIPKNRSVILVHNCFVTREDLDTIMGHFTAPVYWVLCPESNRYISGITPPLELLKTYKCANGEALNICIGTDSLASATSLSMLEQMRLLQAEGASLAQTLDWATSNGAKALNLNHLGEIAVGKKPGLNILSGIDYERMELTNSSRITTII